MEYIMEIRGITKCFDETVVVDNLNFKVEKGRVLGFLGPNGAGKSTTINMISSLLETDSGEILYKGENIKNNLERFKSEIGIVPQNLAIYEDLTAFQNIKFFAELYGIHKSKISEVCDYCLKFVDLEKFKDKKAKNFSGGMKRRLNIACSLVNSPSLIILDEPTVGIDPQSRNFILEAIKKLSNQGVSIIYTTHYMEEVEAIADDVVIIDKGRKILDGKLSDIHSLYTTRGNMLLDTIPKLTQRVQEEIRDIRGVKEISVIDSQSTITVDRDKNNFVLNNIIENLTKNNIYVSSLNYTGLNLESIFLELTGKNLRD